MVATGSWNYAEQYASVAKVKSRGFAFVLALAVLGSQLLVGGVVLACQLDGEVHHVCCCKGEAESSRAAGPLSEDCDCCDVEFVASPESAVSKSNSLVEASSSPATFVSYVTVVTLLAPASVHVRSETVALAYPLPPIFSLNSSFII